MGRDPRRLSYLFPSMPQHVIQRRIRDWYEKRITAGILDTLEACDHYGVSRELLSKQKRESIPMHKQVKIGRRVLYIMTWDEIPYRARRYRRPGSRIIGGIINDEEYQTS